MLEIVELHPRALRAAVLLATFFASLAGLEIALRVSGRFPLPPDRLQTERPELYQEYKPHGYRLWPSRTWIDLYPRQHPRRVIIRSNRFGFRGARELDARDGRVRVVVLGDSMVFGLGVEEPERMTEQLESLHPAWRVDNLGMPGYGADLMVLALETVGVPLRPDVVVLSLYTDDFRRVRPEYAGAGFALPRFELRAGQLVSIPYPPQTLWSRSSTVAALRDVQWRFSRAQWDLNGAILDRFRADAARFEFTPVTMFVPGTWDTPIDQERRTWLRQHSERAGVAFLDLTEAILKRSADPMFIADNPHFSPAGHAVVAQELERFLQKIIGADDRRRGAMRVPASAAR